MAKPYTMDLGDGVMARLRLARAAAWSRRR